MIARYLAIEPARVPWVLLFWATCAEGAATLALWVAR